MVVKQISIFVENKSGRLSEITEHLAQCGINIRALSIADTTDFGILRLIVSDPNKALEVLTANGLTVSTTDVIAMLVNDKVGGLHKALKALNDKSIGIEYMYAFVTREKDDAIVIVRVEDIPAASKALTDAGVTVVPSEKVYNI